MHQTEINMLTFLAFFMKQHTGVSRDRKGGGGRFLLVAYDKTLANSQMTGIPALKLKRRCAILFNGATKAI